MFTEISKKQLYENSNLGFTFQFFSPMRKNELAAKIARNLGKKVKWFKDLDESFKPNYDTFKLSPKYDSGFQLVELETPLLSYQEAIHILLKTMNIIGEVGHTNERCSVNVKINLNEDELQLSTKLDKLNKLKYLLNLNEQEIFEMWPESTTERQKIYQNRISFIHPKNLFSTVIIPSVIERLDPKELNFPESEFFGNNFSDIGKGWISISYIGGKNYQNKKKEATRTINYVIENLYNTLSKNYEYSIEEKRKIEDVLKEYHKVLESIRSPYKLLSMYPNIKFTVDLKDTPFLIESNYDNIKENLFKLIAYGGFTEGQINYDLERKKLQIKDANIKKGILVEGIEFFNSTVEADAKDCLFQACIIKNSKLTECTLLSSNFIKRSKVIECNYGAMNEISSSFLENSDDKMIKADIRGCLVNKGTFSIDSKIDESTKIITKR